jgi:hypothetical protein
MAGITIRLDTRQLDKLRHGLQPRAEQLLGKGAADIERGWKEQIVAKHVVDTGTYLNSVHVESAGPLARVVADGVEYGVYQEYGAKGRPARPCATPAVEAVRAGFIKAWKALFE